MKIYTFKFNNDTLSVLANNKREAIELANQATPTTINRNTDCDTEHVTMPSLN